MALACLSQEVEVQPAVLSAENKENKVQASAKKLLTKRYAHRLKKPLPGGPNPGEAQSALDIQRWVRKIPCHKGGYMRMRAKRQKKKILDGRRKLESVTGPVLLKGGRPTSEDEAVLPTPDTMCGGGGELVDRWELHYHRAKRGEKSNDGVLKKKQTDEL